MKNKLKILFVVPGGIEIPPKNWGAVEKIVWNYKLKLEDLGHMVDIGYPNDVRNKKYDIIHTHMANQVIDISNKGVDNIFSLHDHHVYNNGKNHIYKQNLEAIKKSVISITHAEYLVDYFDDTDKLFFLSHGVDTKKYIDKNIIKNEHKLLCVANNTLLNVDKHDRKGFRLSIESAKELNLPITIVGPRNDNEKFFNNNKDLLEYDKLNIIYEPNEDELIDIFNEHTIFLHQSNLEAGHPNLTLLESLSCGLPVVGTFEGKNDIGGLIRTGLIKEDVIKNIKYVIDNYDKVKKELKDDIVNYDWKNIVSKLEKFYFNVTNIRNKYNSKSFRKKYIDVYENTDIAIKDNINDRVSAKVDYNYGAKVTMTGYSDKKYNIDFIDKNKGNILFNGIIEPGRWFKPYVQYYIDWKFLLKNIKDENDIIEMEMDLKNKDIFIDINYIKGLEDKWLSDVLTFKHKNKCNIYVNHIGDDTISKQYENDIYFIDNDIKEVMKFYASYKVELTENKNILPVYDEINACAYILGLM